MSMNLFDQVRLKYPIPSVGLPAGKIGAVVAVHDSPEKAYEVEFCDSDGKTVAQLPVAEDQLELVKAHRPKAKS